MSEALSQLIAGNRLRELEPDYFEGNASDDSGARIYGGQVMSQALSAAQRCVDADYSVHSMHSYFLQPGDPNIRVCYRVLALRDGRSYCTRQVNAEQAGRLIFSAMLSFHRDEQGLAHQAAMPQVPGPENLASDRDLYRAALGDSAYDWPVEFVQVKPMDLLNPEPAAAKSYTWFRAAGVLPGDPLLHQQLLVYASDNPILSTALRPHGITPFSAGLRVGSLDHTLWFHRACRIDEWLLFVAESDFSGGGRAMSRAQVFDREGRLVASAAQEGFLRYSGAD